ncbi:FF domain protein [Pseudomonas amygdali pv. myricae]|uniref:metal-dependent hydrolase n=1 Tax=Pseudomonas amygdali TaxID=47877 RepID=UPI0006E4C761|nr:metal-dependent hydrolase [Pseudomonas amygdali]KPY00989.1 FF domain protein [Pseudomonas amygdali pv. myricae]RMT43490.1 FF domain protein [Pseudomonas amygdali pv. myricae]RMV01672.1 FF domain protein [Pseudomonas amygdali pv. myricae]RMV34351.1 FF domain protein [Pseudomonas amygdali pv. myricae]
MMNRHTAPVSAELNYGSTQDGLISMIPVRRDLKFDLPADRITDWHNHCVQTTVLLNTMSIVTPLTERYIIESLREYRESIEDPELIEKIDGLVAQEAIHSREHRRYNALIEAAGLPVDQIIRGWQTLYGITKKRWVARWFRLATVMMLEHHTAAASSKLLKMPSILQSSVEGYRDMLTWHSLEELEHKSVSFEVWQQVITPGWRQYVYRTLTTLVISPPFWSAFYISLLRVLCASRRSDKALSGYWQLFKMMFGVRGLISSNAWVWIQYLLPGYHPWKDDNSAALASAMRKLVRRQTSP